MNEYPEDPLDDSSDDASDRDFAGQLKSLLPAPAVATNQASGSGLSVESMLYQAGYQAGRNASQPKQHLDRRITNWFPAVAASLMTAILTAPVVYRIGWQSHASSIETTNVQSVGPDSDAQTKQSPARRSIEQSPIADDVDSKPKPTPDRSKTDSQSPSQEFFRFLQLAQVWHPDSNADSAATGVPTAFQRFSIDSLPRSNWIASSDDLTPPRETITAGDLDNFTVTLGFQVNQR